MLSKFIIFNGCWEKTKTILLALRRTFCTRKKQIYTRSQEKKMHSDLHKIHIKNRFTMKSATNLRIRSLPLILKHNTGRCPYFGHSSQVTVY